MNFEPPRSSARISRIWRGKRSGRSKTCYSTSRAILDKARGKVGKFNIIGSALHPSFDFLK
jgi:hypothetical protein